MENWRSIENYDRYEVSDNGRVRNKTTGRVLRPGINTTGYPIVVLCNDEGHKTRKVHRLVADAFYEGDHTGLVVDHLDGNKQNNNLNNLEYCTIGENNRRAYANGLKTPTHHHNQPNKRRIRIVETGEVFDSMGECANHINGNRRHIGDCLHGRLERHRGYHFEFVD